MRMLQKLILLAAIAAVAALTFTTTASSEQARVKGAMHLTMSIYPAGADEQTLPANIAVRAGGTVTITFRNYTHRFHTFTIRALGVSALIWPATRGKSVALSHVTFVAPYGVYTWRCLFCGTHMHSGTHPMEGKVYAIIAA
jgi:plastocyanin